MEKHRGRESTFSITKRRNLSSFDEEPYGAPQSKDLLVINIVSHWLHHRNNLLEKTGKKSIVELRIRYGEQKLTRSKSCEAIKDDLGINWWEFWRDPAIEKARQMRSEGEKREN